jgi:amino acid adenylation domain-containing protein
VSLYDIFATHLRGGGDRPLLVTPEATYTSADVERESAKVAAWLRAGGIERGDRVVVDLKNGIEAVASLFGVSRVGGVVVGGSPQWSPQQLEHVLADSGAKFLVTNDLRAKQLGSERRPKHVLVHGTAEGTTSWDALDAAWNERIAPEPDDAAILIYTSGTTGKPKGVVHPHKNLADFARIVADYLENTADDRLLWLLGWSFGYGLSQLLTMCRVGGRLVVPASMMPADVLKAHEEHKTTGLAYVPYGWEQLLAFLDKTGRKLEGLRYVTNAGDGPSASLVERLPGALPGARIVLMYGQTECFRTTYLRPELYDQKRGAMGWPIPEVEVDVVDEDGNPCKPGDVGELLHRGALVSAGYWQAPEATAMKFQSNGEQRVLRTGDLVRRDEDGCLWYVGRSELVIKSSGFRFSPREIEDALSLHPAVRSACAFGIDDPALGQSVEAAVVAKPEAAPVDVTALLGHLRQRLPRYMLPRRIHLVDEIPRNPNGKVRTSELRALTATGSPRSR